MGSRLSDDRLRGVLDCLSAGMNPMQVAGVTGVSKSLIYRLHHRLGGVYRPAGTSYSERYLDREQRYELARLREAGLSMRATAQRLGVHASTVSRELARNRNVQTGVFSPNAPNGWPGSGNGDPKSPGSAPIRCCARRSSGS